MTTWNDYCCVRWTPKTISLFLSSSVVLCWICSESSWGFLTWSMASGGIHHFVPSPPLWNRKMLGVNQVFLWLHHNAYITSFTHRSRERVYPHTCCTHWRTHELWGSFQPQRSAQQIGRENIRVYKTECSENDYTRIRISNLQ